MRSRRLLAVASFASLVSFAVPGHAEGQRWQVTYTGGGTAVVKQSGQPATADEGVLICQADGGIGAGGGCLDFGVDPTTASVLVRDDVAGTNVAFQVCVDNDGDGLCTSPAQEGPCADLVVFSHDDAGNFFNPLGPLPVDFNPGCKGGPWRGYVVFLCEGTHVGGGGASEVVAAPTAHSHPATHGTISVERTPAKGSGTFCGGSRKDPSSKRYVVL